MVDGLGDEYPTNRPDDPDPARLDGLALNLITRGYGARQTGPATVPPGNDYRRVAHQPNLQRPALPAAFLAAEPLSFFRPF
jgi:hypothetical protein